MRKAIVMYSSITGNTKKVAEVFANVLKEYHFDVALEKVYPQRDYEKEPIYFDDCDLLCLGAPIIAALPYKEMSSVVGWSGKHVELYKGARPNPSAPGRLRAGVAFATFGGTVAGPRECLPTLELEKEYLQLYGFTPVGQFACPGKQLRHGPVDEINMRLKIDIDDAQALLQRFMENPDTAEFTSMPAEKLEVIRKVAAKMDFDEEGNPLMAGERIMFDNDPLGNGMQGSKYFHYNLQERPHGRDLKTAEFFMTEIVEDFFLTADGQIRQPMGGMYSCIY